MCSFMYVSIAFLSTIDVVFVVFNISSLHANIIYQKDVLYSQFLISKYSLIMHVLLHSQSHLLEFHI